MTGGRSEIAGSVVPRSEAVRRVRSADPNQIVDITIVIRRPASVAASAGETRAEIEQSLSASAADITAVTDFARRYGLTLKEVSPAKRMVRLESTAQAMNRAFGIELAYFDGPNGSFLSYAGPLTVESEVAPSVTAVLGLHQEPVAKSHGE